MGIEEKYVIDCVNYKGGNLLLNTFKEIEIEENIFKENLKKIIPQYKKRLYGLKESVDELFWNYSKIFCTKGIRKKISISNDKLHIPKEINTFITNKRNK